MGEECYKPNGWLGIQMGKAIYLNATSLDAVNSNINSYMERIRFHQSAAGIAPAASVAVVTAPAPSPKAGASTPSMSAELMELFQNLTAKLDQLTAKLDTLHAKVDKLQTQ